MAKESVKILQGKLDVESLISQLNAALAEAAGIITAVMHGLIIMAVTTAGLIPTIVEIGIKIGVIMAHSTTLWVT